MLRKNRELQNIEEKLLTIGKFINDISEQNDMYISDVAELKLKEIEYKYQLNELNLNLNNIINFKPTNIAGETKLETIYPDEVDEPKMVIISFILGFILSSLFFLLRHAIALANNKT